MSTLYIRLPSKAAADSAPHWLALACPFALVSHGSTIERQGVSLLSDLSDTLAKSQRVVVVVAASDVTLLRLQVPPLSSARMKSALPNLVEDQLIADPADCVVVAGGLSGISGSSGKLRTVAVVQRAWLDLLVKTLIGFGAHHLEALPAQLCLSNEFGQLGQSGESVQPGGVTAAIDEWNTDIGMTLRLSEQDGIGLAVNVGQNESTAHEVISTLFAVVPEAKITLYVPQASVLAYQNEINSSGTLNKRINVFADNWSRWIAGANATTLDLMSGLGAGTGPALDWRPWRWPLALTALVLIMNAAALNIDWWRMKSENHALRTAMIQIYKSAYPKESVIIDPIAQMQQKIAISKRESGQAAPDDFTAITAAFGEAWASTVATKGNAPAIAALEYRERSLFVRFKPGGEAPTQQVKDVLAKYGLSLGLAMQNLASEQSGAVVWQIRSAK